MRTHNTVTKTGLLVLSIALLLAVAACDNPTSTSDEETEDSSPTEEPDPEPEPEPEPELPPLVTLRGGIVVNEFLADPTGDTNVDVDGNGEATSTDEFLELYNTGADPVDLAGLELFDPSAGAWFTVEQEALLQPGGFAAVLVKVGNTGSLPDLPEGNHAFDAGYYMAILNNGGDNILLLDREAGEYLHIVYNGAQAMDPTVKLVDDGFPADAVRLGDIQNWGSPTSGASLGRDPDGIGIPTVHLELGEPASPGTSNAE